MNSTIRLLTSAVCVGFAVLPLISYSADSTQHRIELECWEVDLTQIGQDSALELMSGKGVLGVFTRPQYQIFERMLGSKNVRSIGKASLTSGMSTVFHTNDAQGFEVRPSVLGTSPSVIELEIIEVRPKTILGLQLQDRESSVRIWDDYFVAYRPVRSPSKVRFITAKLVAKSSRRS